MGFVQTESWTETRSSVVSNLFGRLPHHRLLRNVMALTLSLVIDTGLILALMSLVRESPPAPQQAAHSITTFDLASVSAQQEGARTVATAPTPATPLASVEARPSPIVPREWTTVTLPPAAPPVAMPPQPQPAVAAPAQGLAMAGTGSGAGYDPYAFASYRKPDPARVEMVNALQPLADAPSRLRAALSSASGSPHQSINLRAHVAPSGRIIRVELLSPALPNLAEQLARIAPGFLLCASDASRPSDSSLMVSLTL